MSKPMDATKQLGAHHLNPGWSIWTGMPGASDEGYITRRRLYSRKRTREQFVVVGGIKWAVRRSHRAGCDLELDHILQTEEAS